MWRYVLILLAILYILMPRDLIPDAIFGLGWLDDIVVSVVLWQIYVRLKQRFPFRGESSGRFRREPGRDDGPTAQRRPPPREPHDVLGVPPNATRDEIKRAYRKLASQYHPDKLAHLGDDFRALAESRFKEIQSAYQKLTGK